MKQILQFDLLFKTIYTPCNFQKTLKIIKRYKHDLEH